jgi:hypothetical protein
MHRICNMMVEALIEKGTMNGDEVDGIIFGWCCRTLARQGAATPGRLAAARTQRDGIFEVADMTTPKPLIRLHFEEQVEPADVSKTVHCDI